MVNSNYQCLIKILMTIDVKKRWLGSSVKLVQVNDHLN